MSSSRRRFVAGAASLYAGIGILRYPADAAQFTFRYANDNTLTHPMTKAAQWWADKVKEDTSGQVEIQVFPSSQLGSDPSMLTQLRVGSIQFLHFSGDNLSSLVPGAGIDSVAFAFRKYDDPWKALDGDLGAYIRGQVEAAGLHIFNRVYDTGLRVLTNNMHAIHTPADVKGLKFRVPPNEIVTSMMRDLGASPVSISIAEVYTSLQTHIVDGTENDVLNIENGKVYEVQKYCSLTNQRWAGYWFVANKAAWQSLPKKLQDVIAHDYDQSVDIERADSLKLHNTLQPKLESQGMVFNTADVAPFRAALQASGYYKEWREKFGAKEWQLLEKYTGPLPSA